jgi:hypothetical protein
VLLLATTTVLRSQEAPAGQTGTRRRDFLDGCSRQHNSDCRGHQQRGKKQSYRLRVDGILELLLYLSSREKYGWRK